MPTEVDDMNRLRVKAERRLAELEELAAMVIATEERCTNYRRFPNGCGECLFCTAARLMRSQSDADLKP
jgi:hypothetical protein